MTDLVGPNEKGSEGLQISLYLPLLSTFVMLLVPKGNRRHGQILSLCFDRFWKCKLLYLLLMLIMSNPPAWSFWSASAELLKMRYCSAWGRGISCNWLPESFVKMLAEHVLCPPGSISLMVHLYLWCAEVSTRKGCFSLRLLGNNSQPTAVIKALYCICLANSKSWEDETEAWQLQRTKPQDWLEKPPL